MPTAGGAKGYPGIVANPALGWLGSRAFRSRPFSTQRTGPIASQVVQFDLGGTSASQTVVFDIWTPHTTIYWPMLTLSSASFKRAAQIVNFDILGFKAASQTVIFDLGETGSIATIAVVFDIEDDTGGQVIDPGVYVEPTVLAVPVVAYWPMLTLVSANTPRVVIDSVQTITPSGTISGGTYTLTFDGQTTSAIAFDADAATVQAALIALSNLAAGDVVVTGGPSNTTALVLTFGGAYAGTAVPLVVVTSSLTGTDPALSVVMTTVGSKPTAGGTFLPGIQVYSKAGVYLGAMTYTSYGPRPKSISNWQGVNASQMTATIPRKIRSTNGNFIANPDLALIVEDRILVIGNSFGLEPWAGSIDTVEWTDGAAILTVQDLYGQLATAIIRDTAEIKTRTGTLATGLVSIVMGMANAWLGQHGEVQWETDATGSLTFFGDDYLSGDCLAVLGKIATQSFGEFCWDVRVEAARVVPILVWRDSFSAGAGVALADGDAGNVRANPSYSTSVTQLVNAVRLVGAVTRIESKIPPGAKALPVQEVIPVAEVWLPTPTYRRRTNLSLSAPVTLNVEVPYSFDEETQQEVADEADKAMRDLFKTFIHAIHDQYGRPWHDGWSWAGPGPEDTNGSDPNSTLNLVPERVLHLKDYVNWLHLASGPAAIVMKHRSEASYVRVTYDRVNAVQKVARFSSPGDIDPATVFDFEWRRMNEWDPRRDGVGREVQVRTVIAGAVRSLTAWRLVPWGQGDQDFITQLAYGITAAATNLPVLNAFGFPPVPFDAKISTDEWVRVTAISGNILTVIRGQLGTTASIHEVGEEVAYFAPAADATDVEEEATDQLAALDPLEVPWPDGIAYANALLAKWSVPSRLLTLQLANVGGDWATVAIGSTHTLNLQTEGPDGGITENVRVIGFAPDDVAGTMELLVEVT